MNGYKDDMNNVLLLLYLLIGYIITIKQETKRWKQLKEDLELLNILKFMPSPAAKKISKVVKSATNNAEEAVSSGSSNLIIKDIINYNINSSNKYN